MNPEDRKLIVAIGRAARTCALYRELLEVARRYQAQDEIDRLSAALAQSDAELSRLIAIALEDDAASGEDDAAPGQAPTRSGDEGPSEGEDGTTAEPDADA